MNSAYALSQVLFALMAFVSISNGVAYLGRWSGLVLGFSAAAAWLAICFLFLQYPQPRMTVAIFTALLLGVACTRLPLFTTGKNKPPGVIMKLNNRTILITGGTSGIGLELARQLLSKGNTVLITGRDEDKLIATKRTLPMVNTFRSDASKPDDIAALYTAVCDKFPTLDTLINNAGIMRNLDLNQQRSLTDVTKEIDIDLTGPIQMVQQFLPHLKTQRNALIVNLSSGLAFVPFPLSPIYSAAKAAIHAYTRCLRVQLKGTGISVVELAPPGVETPLFRAEFAEEMKGQKGMPVEDLAKKAIAGIEAGKAEIRPGLSNVLYFLSRLAPQLPFGQMAKMFKSQGNSK